MLPENVPLYAESILKPTVPPLANTMLLAITTELLPMLKLAATEPVVSPRVISPVPAAPARERFKVPALI